MRERERGGREREGRETERERDVGCISGVLSMDELVIAVVLS